MGWFEAWQGGGIILWEGVTGMRMQIAALPRPAWERCSKASRKPLTSRACAGSPLGRDQAGAGGGSGETPERGWGGVDRPEAALASGQKAEGSPLSPKAESLLLELNGFTEPTNQEEQFLSTLINNLEHLPHTRRCLRGWGGRVMGGM